MLHMASSQSDLEVYIDMGAVLRGVPVITLLLVPLNVKRVVSDIVTPIQINVLTLRHPSLSSARTVLRKAEQGLRRPVPLHGLRPSPPQTVIASATVRLKKHQPNVEPMSLAQNACVKKEVTTRWKVHRNVQELILGRDHPRSKS